MKAGVSIGSRREYFFMSVVAADGLCGVHLPGGGSFKGGNDPFEHYWLSAAILRNTGYFDANRLLRAPYDINVIISERITIPITSGTSLYKFIPYLSFK